MQSQQINPALRERRDTTAREWRQFQEKLETSRRVRPEIGDSWQRNLPAPDRHPVQVPLEDPYETRYRWHECPIREVARRELGQLMELTQESECVAAISDASGRLLWTYSSRHMELRAADEHFIAGGNWLEQSAGTNAVGLCLVTRKPVTVFAAEHLRPSLHEWVCYAAPIIEPGNGRIIGVLDLSSTWDRHNALGQAAVDGMAQRIARRLPRPPPPRSQPDLVMNFLGNPAILFRGRPFNLSLRHQEILCLLALHPEGMSLEALHAAIYGDNPITKSTLKSEICTLRSRLDGQIGSRPYQLRLSHETDFAQLWAALRNKELDRALSLYRGPLLTSSNSPEIEQWRHCLDAIMCRKLDACDDLGQLVGAWQPGMSELVRERIIELAD
ncbi:MAG: GAF domain-containing protein [Thiothrix sp.]|nr:GAF domain-containing protein [Thiothrix sp.]HPE59521.1 GAF domain-containing protein [Thiolinea sp.]